MPCAVVVVRGNGMVAVDGWIVVDATAAVFNTLNVVGESTCMLVHRQEDLLVGGGVVFL